MNSAAPPSRFRPAASGPQFLQRELIPFSQALKRPLDQRASKQVQTQLESLLYRLQSQAPPQGEKGYLADLCRQHPDRQPEVQKLWFELRWLTDRLNHLRDEVAWQIGLHGHCEPLRGPLLAWVKRLIRFSRREEQLLTRVARGR